MHYYENLKGACKPDSDEHNKKKTWSNINHQRDSYNTSHYQELRKAKKGSDFYESKATIQTCARTHAR
jgi:hypothetical protein